MSEKTKQGSQSSEPTKDASREEDLERITSQIKDLMVKADRRQIKDQHAIACKCLEIKNGTGNRYGKRAVKKAAERLGLTIGWINQMARVPEIWPSETDITNVAARKNKHGLSLSWTHLVLLAHVEDAELRSRMLEDAFREGLSVRDLRARIAEATGKRNPKKEAAAKFEPSKPEPTSDQNQAESMDVDEAAPVADDAEETVPPGKDICSLTTRVEEILYRLLVDPVDDREVAEAENAEVLASLSEVTPEDLTDRDFESLIRTSEQIKGKVKIWSDRLTGLQQLRDKAPELSEQLPPVAA